MQRNVTAECNFGVPEYTNWSKVRIHSRLSQSMSQVQLYVQSVGNSLIPCMSDTMDVTYATLASSSTRLTDFGSAASCVAMATSTRVDLQGTPFSIPNQAAAWTADPGPCNFAPTLAVACTGAQDCTATIQGYCGLASFRGLLGVYNASQFEIDVRVACALNGSDPLLSCNGDEKFCSDICTPCPAGTYSQTAGTSSCSLCGAGTFSTSIGTADSLGVVIM